MKGDGQMQNDVEKFQKIAHFLAALRQHIRQNVDHTADGEADESVQDNQDHLRFLTR